MLTEQEPLTRSRPRRPRRPVRRPYPPLFRPQALHRGVGALNVLDQCSARSPRSVLEMVGASSRRTPRLPLTKGTRDRNAVEKRWWPARRIFPIFGAIMSSCSRSIAGGAIWYPFSPETEGGNHMEPRARTSGLEGDANVQRNIFELDGGRPQPLPQGPRKQLERRG